MADTSAQERTPASQRKLDKARAEGPGRAFARPRRTSRRSPPAARCWSPLRRCARSPAEGALAAGLQFDRRRARRRRHDRPLAERRGSLGGGGAAVRPGDDAASPSPPACCVAAGPGPRSRWRRSSSKPRIRSPASAACSPSAQLIDALKAMPAGAAARRASARSGCRAQRRRTSPACSRCRCRRRSRRPAATLIGGGLVLIAARPGGVSPLIDVPLQTVPARRAAEDEPPGAEAGAQGVRGQLRGQGQDAGADARDDASAA